MRRPFLLLAGTLLFLTPALAKVPPPPLQAQLERQGQEQLDWDARSPLVTQGGVLHVES